MFLTRLLRSEPLEIASQPDDAREATDWPMSRIVVVAQFVIAVLTLIFWAVSWGIELTGLRIGIESDTLSSWAGLGFLAILFGSQPLIHFLGTRYREQAHEPIESASQSLIGYRSRSEAALKEAGFSLVGAFQVRGMTSKTQTESYLGCERMVIAEFFSQGRRKGIELVSITESGRVVATASVPPIYRVPAEQSFPQIVVSITTDSCFERLLSIHLRKATEVSEQEESDIAELTEHDVVDVLRYYNRAFHNALVGCRKANGAVGPMTYGRFRYPLGLVTSQV